MKLIDTQLAEAPAPALLDITLGVDEVEEGAEAVLYGVNTRVNGRVVHIPAQASAIRLQEVQPGVVRAAMIGSDGVEFAHYESPIGLVFTHTAPMEVRPRTEDQIRAKAAGQGRRVY